MLCFLHKNSKSLLTSLKDISWRTVTEQNQTFKAVLSFVFSRSSKWSKKKNKRAFLPSQFFRHKKRSPSKHVSLLFEVREAKGRVVRGKGRIFPISLTFKEGKIYGFLKINMKLFYFDPSRKLHVPWCTQELLLKILSWATLDCSFIHPLCGAVSMAWVTVTTRRDKGPHLHATLTPFSHWICHKTGLKKERVKALLQCSSSARRVQLESGKRHPPTSTYGHFAFLDLSESLIVPLSPLTRRTTQSCDLKASCVFISASEQMIHLPLFIILSPISWEVKVCIMHHCCFQERACRCDTNDTRKKVWFELIQRVSR